MLQKRSLSRFVSLVALASYSFLAGLDCNGQQVTGSYTVSDEIGITLLQEDPNGTRGEVLFSPDGHHFAVWSERGRLDINRVEDSVRFYRTLDIQTFLDHSEVSQMPSPEWIVNRTGIKGPVINDLRWLADSTGVAFLEEEGPISDKRLVLLDLRRRKLEPLTSGMDAVVAFDVRDRRHYAYTVADLTQPNRAQNEHSVPAMVGTGRTLNELLLPDTPMISHYLSPHGKLWAVVDGKRFEVNGGSGPIIASGWNSSLALSPDGSSLVMRLPVLGIPSSWEALYPPPYPGSPHRLQAIGEPVVQYFRIELRSGLTQNLTNAPTSDFSDWWAYGGPSWSNDGKEILLPGTFFNSKDKQPSRPCVGVVDVSANTRTCVETLKSISAEGSAEEGYHVVTGADFVNGDSRRIRVYFRNHDNGAREAIEYHRVTEGSWQLVNQTPVDPDGAAHGLQVSVKQGLNEPPLLVATNNDKSRIIWDPNPQLKKIDFGEAKVLEWKDNEGRKWQAGLYMPRDYRAGQHYPLVIQTHGFLESEFRPSGSYQTAFAARALAAVGILVLQISDEQVCLTTTSREGLCAVSGYNAAVTKLVSEGIADPNRIGIIGFSRTCFYVMQALTTDSPRFKAASITDGVMEDYLQYILSPELFSNEANRMIGAPPFGEGLQLWLKRSPGFNLDKITTPLSIVAEGPQSLLLMWESISADGRIGARLDDNRQIEFKAAEHRHFDHGYAVTSHSAQGLTSERVLIHADTSVHPDLLNSRFG